MLFHDPGRQQRSQPHATAVGFFRVNGPQCFPLSVCQYALGLLRHNLLTTQEAAVDAEASESGW